MTTRRNHAAAASWAKATEFAFAVPQVVAHRLTRMATAGLAPTARDRKEFTRMSAEKVAAFAESWNAMAIEGFRVQQQASLLWWRAFWMPWLSGDPSQQLMSQLRGAQRSILGKGFAPVHRRAVANARRLARVVRR